MAVEATNTNQTGTDTGIETNGASETNENSGSAPTVEELMAQLASERAEKEKYKNASNKASSEAAKYKKELRSKQTAEEQEAEAKAEAERARQEETDNMRKELNYIKAVNAYKTVSDNVVESLIEAVTDVDHNAIAAIIESEKKAAVKEAQAEWQKSRPRVNMGGDGTITKEKFDKMDLIEKTKLYRENKEMYDRLNGR